MQLYRHKWQPFGKNLLAKHFEKIKRYGDQDLRHMIKTGRSAFSGKPKSCFSNCLVIKTKEKTIQCFETKFYRRLIKIQNLSIFRFTPAP